MRSKGIVVFVLFATLLVWPVFEVFNVQVLFLGIPLPLLYLFTVWGLSVIVAYREAK